MTHDGPPWNPGPPPPEPNRNKGWWRTKWLLVIPVVLALGIAGGLIVPTAFRSPRSSSKKTVPAVGAGYLASARTGVFFIQWTDTGGRLRGSAQLVRPAGSAPTARLTTRTITVTGRIKDSTIVLSFDRGPQEFGTLSGGNFTVNFPQRGGTLSALTFHSASVVAYDNAVAKMRSRVETTNAAAVAARRLQADRAAVDRALTTLKSTLAELTAIESKLPGLETAVQSALTSEAADLTRTLAAAGTVTSTTPTSTSVCTGAFAVRTDAFAVRTDAFAVRTATETVAQYLDTTGSPGLRQVMNNVISDSQALQHAEAAVPSYRPTEVPTTAAIQQALSTATSAGSSTVAQVNKLIAQANSDMSAAYQAATQALAKNACGTVSATPPLTSISW